MQLKTTAGRGGSHTTFAQENDCAIRLITSKSIRHAAPTISIGGASSE